MKVIPAVLMLVSVFTTHLYGATTDYFPLAVGNVWEYEIWYNYDGIDYYNDSYATRTVTVYDEKQWGDTTCFYLIDSTFHTSSITITGYLDTSGAFNPDTVENIIFHDSINIYSDKLLLVNDTIYPTNGPSVFIKLPYYLKNYDMNELPFSGKFIGDTIA